MIDFEVEKNSYTGVSIKVIGIGGAGSNTVNSLFNSGCSNIECIIANTDAQALENAQVPNKIQIGVKTTKGLGAGANPDLGQRSAEEDLDKVLEMIGDANIVFLTGGMGGGTASGALPVIARAVKERGILAIAVVTKPFGFEGKRRARIAQEAIERLSHDVDTLIVIPNQKLIEVVDQKMSMIDAFSMINSILSQSVKGISDIIVKPGHINVDFADVRVIMKDMGLAVLGTGRATGPDRALEAAMEAISSPLLENMCIDGARGVLLNITGGHSLGLHEISAAASLVYERVDENANIILGSVIDGSMGDEVSVTIIATGFAQNNHKNNAAKDQAESSMGMKKTMDTVQVGSVVFDQPTLKEKFVQDPQKKSGEIPTARSSESSVQADSKDISVDLASNRNSLLDADYDMSDLDVPAYLRKNNQDSASGN